MFQIYWFLLVTLLPTSLSQRCLKGLCDIQCTIVKHTCSLLKWQTEDKAKTNKRKEHLVDCLEYLLSKLQKKYRTMLQDSFSEQPDLPTSLLCFILFTGYLLSRGSNTNCLCFALRSFLIRLPSTFQLLLHLYTPSRQLLSSYRHPSVQNTIFPNKVLWSVLFLLPGFGYLEPTPCFCPPFYLCKLF